MFFDVFIKVLRALHLTHHSGARMLFQHRAGEQDEQFIAPQQSTFFIDHTETVGIAIKADADLRSFFFDAVHQRDHIFFNGWVGMMVGEGAVGFAELFNGVHAQFTNQAWSGDTETPVAAVQHHFHRTFDVDDAFDLGAIGVLYVLFPGSPTAGFEIVVLDERL